MTSISVLFIIDSHILIPFVGSPWREAHEWLNFKLKTYIAWFIFKDLSSYIMRQHENVAGGLESLSGPDADSGPLFFY